MRKGEKLEKDWEQDYQQLLKETREQNDLELMVKINSRFTCDRDCKTCSEDDFTLCIRDLKIGVITACAELKYVHERMDELKNILISIAKTVHATISAKVDKTIDEKNSIEELAEEILDLQENEDHNERPRIGEGIIPKDYIEPVDPTIGEVSEDTGEKENLGQKPDEHKWQEWFGMFG
jgi:hypothetical protein